MGVILGALMEQLARSTVDRPLGTAPDLFDRARFAAVVVRQKLGFTRYFATARPEAGGRFLISGLPAGDYFAIAVEWADPVATADPDLLEPLARDATPFTLGDAEAKSLDLRRIK